MKDYEFSGESRKVSDKYTRKQAGTALSQFRFSLNQFIDRGCDKPIDLNPEYWKALVAKRGSKEGKEMFERMASIARGPSHRHTTKKAVRESVIVHLVREIHFKFFL